MSDRAWKLAARAALFAAATLTMHASSPAGAPHVPPDGMTLWNGRDLDGWELVLKDSKVEPTAVWSAADSVLRLDGRATHGYLRTRERHSQYRLHLEWRWPTEAGNSGVLLHVQTPDAVWPVSLEVQLKSGVAGDLIGQGGVEFDAGAIDRGKRRAKKQADSSEKPLGEWNEADIYCRGDQIEVFVNGVRQNSAGALSVNAGQIALQLEGALLELRNVWLAKI